MDVYKRLEELNIVLPQAPAKGGVYMPVKEFGNGLAYLSGCGPQNESEPSKNGKLGKELTLEEGQQAARNCVLNLLAVLHANIGDLNRVKRFVKVLAFVQSADDFYDQPQVVNGGSGLLLELFGEEAGCAARSAIGVNALPGNIPVEIEALVELERD